MVRAKGPNTRATIRQLSHVGALIESRSLLLPGTTVVLSFILPGADLSFSVRGTILNSSYEPDLSEDGELIGSNPGVDIQFAPLPSSDESKIRAWVLQNLPRTSELS